MKKLFATATFLFCIAVAFAQDTPEGLFINSRAYDFKAKDQNGNEVVLKDLRKKGPVVVLFYRGYWSPYCTRELKNIQDSLQFLTDKGAYVVAITPEAPEGIAKTVEKSGATFPIIYDEDMKIAKAYNVSFHVDDDIVRRYKSSDIDLLTINHQKDQAFLAVPAVYIINKEGSVIYRYFDTDYRKRVPVKELLNNLK